VRLSDYNPWNGYPITMMLVTIGSSVLLGFLWGSEADPAARSMLVWAVACVATGFFFAAYFYRSAYQRAQAGFNRYRAAMLDDWRTASDKVIRMRNLILLCRSVTELRIALRNDDLEHPSFPIGAPTVRSPGPVEPP